MLAPSTSFSLQVPDRHCRPCCRLASNPTTAAMSSPPEPPPLTPDQEARIHEDRGPVVYGVSSVIIALCIIAVALRLVARFNRRMKVGLDDWLAVGALVSRRHQGGGCGRDTWLTPAYAPRSLPSSTASLVCLVRHLHGLSPRCAAYTLTLGAHSCSVRHGKACLGCRSDADMESSPGMD